MTLATRLRAALEAGIGAPGADDYPHPAERTAAAVLVAITDRPGPGVILTLRDANLRRHAGQVAFPGGRVDPGDADAVAAALREAEEEIGLPRGLPHVVGLSDPWHTGTGFDITPVVAVVPPDLPLVPREAEVADIFEVPLAFLLAPSNHIAREVEMDGVARRYHEIGWEGRRIWGATAGMIVNLAARLRGLA